MTVPHSVLGDQTPLPMGYQPTEEHPQGLVWGQVGIVPVVFEHVKLMVWVFKVHTPVEGKEGQPLVAGKWCGVKVVAGKWCGVKVVAGKWWRESGGRKVVAGKVVAGKWYCRKVVWQESGGGESGGGESGGGKVVLQESGVAGKWWREGG